MAGFRFLNLQDKHFLEYAIFMHKNGKSKIVPMHISIFLLPLIHNFKFIKMKWSLTEKCTYRIKCFVYENQT